MLTEAGFEVRFPEDKKFGRGLSNELETIQVIQDAAAVIAGNDLYSGNVLRGLPKLRVVARAGVGYDRVDVNAATERRIAVAITPNANHEGVAEHSLALLFAVAKSVVAGDQSTRAGRWRIGLPEPLRGKTFGILGLGRIGRSTALRAAALGMEVIATETHPDAEFVRENSISLVDFDALLQRSDFLSLHCPLTPSTQGLFDREVFAKMKRGSVLINTAPRQVGCGIRSCGGNPKWSHCRCRPRRFRTGASGSPAAIVSTRQRGYDAACRRN